MKRLSVDTSFKDCPKNFFLCYKTRICINIFFVCDTITDCPDREDEELCSKTDIFFKCKSSEKISASIVCNGITDCYDGSDEILCGL